jgi:hypothetical protein
MNEQQQKDRLVPFLDVIEALKKRDPPLNDWATRTLLQAGPHIIPHLFVQAVDETNKPTHRVRILEVVEAMEVDVGPHGRFVLHWMLGDASTIVRRKTADLLRKMIFEWPDKRAEERQAKGSMPSMDELVSPIARNPQLCI